MMLDFGHLIILASALLHATWNAMLKKSGAGASAGAWVLIFAMICTWVGVTLSGQLSQNLGWESLQSPLVQGGLMAGIFEGIYFVSLQRALEKYPLGWTYLVTRAGAMAIVWVVSLLFYGETLNWIQGLGVAAVAIGIYLAQPSHTDQARAHEPRRPWKAWGITGLCASAIAGYHFCYKHFLAQGAPPFPLFGIAISLSTVLFLASFASGKPALLTHPLPRQARPWVLGAGALCAASFLLYLYGLPLMGAGISLTLRNTSILFAQLLAWWSGEKMTPRQWIAAGLVFLGAILL